MILFLVCSCTGNKKELSSTYQLNYLSVRESESPWGVPKSDIDGTGWGKRQNINGKMTIDLGKEKITIEGFVKKEFLILNAAEIQSKFGHNWNGEFLVIHMKVKDLTNNRECKFMMYPFENNMQFYLTYPEIEYCYLAKRTKVKELQ